MIRSAAGSTLPPSDPFYYGWRFIKKRLADGSEDLVKVPLTLRDVLHPREGDVIPERTLQEQDAEYLRPIFRERAEQLAGGLFLADCLIDWGVPGLEPVAPDLAAFRDVTRPPPGDFGLFRVRPTGGRCVLVVEIASPHTRVNDVRHKFRIYHRVRAPLYVLIDQARDHGPREVIGYRYTAQRYVRMRLDRQGRLLLRPLGLLLGLEDNHAVCYDAGTGERLGGYQAEREGRLAAEERVRELEAELRRLRGE